MIPSNHSFTKIKIINFTKLANFKELTGEARISESFVDHVAAVTKCSVEEEGR